jgi:peptide-methionine (R)-S-oxide reductase
MDEWGEKLSPEQYRVLRKKGTERPFTGKYYRHRETGMYVCAACGAELFSSDAKFYSKSGWPSFTEPANTEHVRLEEDLRMGMRRVAVLCRNCGGHLGHVFNDGPTTQEEAGHAEPTGKRFCINSAALDFKKKR